MMKKKTQLMQMILLSLFAALIALLGFTPLGLIPLGFINVTILCVPVIVGALLMGPKNGMILGLVFGAVSVISAFLRPSALVSTLMGASPLLMVVMSVVPRLLVPLVAWGVQALLEKRGVKASCAIAAACGSLTNTFLYMGLMLLFYILCGIDTAAVLAMIGGVVLIAGSLEAVANAVIVSAAMAALRRLRK